MAEPTTTPQTGVHRPGPGPTRVAVVGAGFIAKVHLQLLAPKPGVKVPLVERVS
ncbi:MAG: hypothetical protein V3U11_10905 [Planctomycetota bacterium]